jgi:hypothetical protein
MSGPFDFKSRLNKIAPASPPAMEEATKVDQVAERHDFVSREPAQRIQIQREPLDQVLLKGPLSVISRFKLYCQDNRLSYWRGIDELLKGAGR